MMLLMYRKFELLIFFVATRINKESVSLWFG